MSTDSDIFKSSSPRHKPNLFIIKIQNKNCLMVGGLDMLQLININLLGERFS